MERGEYKGINNEAYIIGKIIKVEGEGIHGGVRQVIVCVEELRESEKKNHVLLLLPKCESTFKLIEKKSVIKAEGILTSSYTFNNNEKKHTYIVPSNVEVLDKEYKLEAEEEFYLNYTLYNRVIMRGKVCSEPTFRYIESVGKGLYRFKINYEGDGGKESNINCTLWETVNDINKLSKGDKIFIVGSFKITNKFTLNYPEKIVDDSEYTTYNILVQKIYDLSTSPEDIAKEIYKEEII